MKTRFSIPPTLFVAMGNRNKPLFQLTESDFSGIHSRMVKLRGDLHKRPHITVAIIAHNEEKNLFATLQTVSYQITNMRVEVLVIDNYSTDNTAILARKCGAKVVIERKLGVAFARQKALELAQGRYYVSCDADTLYPPNWLQTLVKPLKLKRTISVTYSLHCLIDEQHKYSIGFLAYQYAKLLFVYLRNLKRGQLNCGGASMAFKTVDARLIGGYNTTLQRGSDGYIALQLSGFGAIQMVADKDAFVYTSNRRMLNDGSVWRAFIIRMKYGLRHLFSFFTYQKIPVS